MERFTVIAAIALACLASCSKEKTPDPNNGGDLIVEVIYKTKVSADANEKIKNLTILIGPYDTAKGTYGPPDATTYCGDGSQTSFLFSSLTPGDRYIAVVANRTGSSIPESVAQLDAERWTMDDFQMPKSAITTFTLANGQPTKVSLTLKQNFSRIAIGDINTSTSEVYLVKPTRVYLQNVPAYGTGYFDSSASRMPDPLKTGEGYWINHDGSTGLTDDKDILKYVSWPFHDPTYSTVKAYFYCPPNTTSRKTALVIEGEMNVGDNYVRKCYYRVVFNELRPNTSYSIKSVLVKSPGAETPNEYTGPEDIEVVWDIVPWKDMGTVTEQL